MANWAKLQEDLVGLPVAKRAKHGIHFKKGADEFVANFSGKPCHYEDAGLWKPIDTKLVLLPDGFYGCPHSPVRVHSDGRVKVEGTDYAQRVELPSAKTGLADGDKLIREFSFGKQEMRITENGYRSEITLNRIPTLKEARKLIASESGTLSKAYLKSLTTATDANGDTHTVSTLSAFRTWLASAVFPVVIDPDFSTTSSAGDNYLLSSIPQRNYGSSTSTSISPSMLYRFIFDSISASSICTAANISITRTYGDMGHAGYATQSFYQISDANGDWVEGTKDGSSAGAGESCYACKASDGAGGITTAWAGSAGCATADTDYINTILASININYNDAIGTSYTGTFNSSGLAVLQGWFGDATNNGFVTRFTGGIGGWTPSMATSEHATESYRPVLTVTYTAAGTFIPINMNAQMQSLSGGMRG